MFIASPLNLKEPKPESVKMLNTLRNKFIHFLPMGLLLDVSGLPQVVNDCLKIIDFLAFESRNVLWHKKKSFKTRTRELVEKAMAQAFLS